MQVKDRIAGLFLLVALLFVQQAGLTHAVWHALQSRDASTQEDPAPLVHGTCALCSASTALGHALPAPRLEIGAIVVCVASGGATDVAVRDQHVSSFLSRAPPLA